MVLETAQRPDTNSSQFICWCVDSPISRGQESGSVFSVAVCKVQAKKCCIKSLTTWPWYSRVLHVFFHASSLMHTPTYTQGACYSRVDPTPVKNPTLVAHSPMALSLLDITPAEVARPEFLEYFSGSKTLPGSEPASHCYCGHQFGYFSGQLGDGCAQ